MSKQLTEKQYRVASALTDPARAHLCQQDIGAELGIASSSISLTLKSVAVKVGLDGCDTGYGVMRARIAAAAHKAGGFGQLAADLGLYDRIGESVQ